MQINYKIKELKTMINILMSGCNGRMGQVIASLVNERDDVQIICGVDTFDGIKNNFPVYSDFSNIGEKVDVIIDFSNPSALGGLLEYAVNNSVPAVLCTTGYSDEQISDINKASEKVAVEISIESAGNACDNNSHGKRAA